MGTLSVIIISKNESKNIFDCVKSAAFADEVLVLDSGSNDNTAEIARSAGATVLETDWPGYGPQKNRAIEASKSEWLFSLDADERISPTLAAEIRTAMNSGEFQVYDVPRSSKFVSKFMQHSGWWPDRTKRLFKRGTAQFTLHEVHEHLQSELPTGHLNEPLIHFSYDNFETVLDKMNRYSSGGAQELHKKGKNGSLSSAIMHGVWAFIRTYFLRAGFLDGREGFMLAVSNAEVTYYRYIKLYYLNLTKK